MDEYAQLPRVFDNGILDYDSTTLNHIDSDLAGNENWVALPTNYLGILCPMAAFHTRNNSDWEHDNVANCFDSSGINTVGSTEVVNLLSHRDCIDYFPGFYLIVK